MLSGHVKLNKKFTLYMQLGVECHWKHHFVGAVCYAHDLSLLVPSQATLRLMLHLCEHFADSHGLRFNLFVLDITHLLTVPVDSHSVVPHFVF